MRHHLGADVGLADGEMDTSHRNAMFATRGFVEHGDVRQSDVCWLVVGLRCTMLTISSCSSTVCIDLRSDDTCTLGSVPHSRNAQNTLVKTARFGVLRNGYLLRYSSAAVFALPLQYPYT